MLLFVASFRKDERKLERLPLSFFGLFVSSSNCRIKLNSYFNVLQCSFAFSSQIRTWNHLPKYISITSMHSLIKPTEFFVFVCFVLYYLFRYKIIGNEEV